MTEQPNAGLSEEISLPENLLPLETILGHGVTPMDVSMVLAKIFRVQYTEVALLRLESGLLRFVFPEHLRTTGAIPLSSKAVAAHTALSKKPNATDSEEAAAPNPIQKLMSVPIMDQDMTVVGVIQISRKALDARFAQDFSREDLHDLELAAGILASAPAIMLN
jgi:GAF domain-containing protein